MTPYYDEDGITIYQGDCREILPLLTERAAVTVTSPPYWNVRSYIDISFPSYDAYTDWLLRILEPLYEVTDWLVWIAGYVWQSGRMFDCSGDAARLAESVGFCRRQQVPWVKANYAPQPSIDLAPAHELIQVMNARQAPANWDALRVDRRHQERLWTVASERPSAGAQRGGGHWGYERMDGKKQPPNVLVTNKHNGNDWLGHPAAFPPEVVDPWILACSQPGQMVLDPFMGSGTTLKVAKDMGRRAIGIEIEERYCEIAVQRLAQGVLPLFTPSTR